MKKLFARSFACVGMLLLGFLGMAAALHVLLVSFLDPFQLYAENRSEKISHLHANHREFAVAAFGSSRVHTAFDPRVFDATLRARGVGNVESLNLAVVGGSQTEQYAMALRFIDYLAVNNIKEAVVILEVTAGLNLQPSHLVHPRAINLHSAEVTDFAVRFTDLGRAPVRAMGRAGYAMTASALHFLNTGLWASLVFPHPPDSLIESEQYSSDRRGFLPRTSDQYRETILEMFNKRKAQTKIAAFEAQPGYAVLVERLALSASSEKVKVHFVYVAMPTLAVLSSRSEWPDQILTKIGEIPVIDFTEGSALLAPQYWNDRSHLSKSGAVVFSQLLAERLVPLLSELSHNSRVIR